VSPGAPAKRTGGVLLVAEQLRRAVPGGIGTYIEGLVAGLDALEPGRVPPVALVASRVVGPDPLERLGRPVESSGLGPRATVLAWDLGLRSVGRDRAVVHATSFAVPPSTAPTVVTVHDLAFQSVPDAYPRRGRRWHEAALGRAVRRAAAFVTPSEPVAAALRSVLGRSPVTVTVIEEGADHLPPPDPAAAADLLERLGAVDGFLLAVGTLEPRKNLVRLIEAYVEIRPALPAPWPLVVVGPAGWGAGLEPPPAGVVLAGRVPAPALAALYATCRCLAYVPLAEGFGLPVVEAMRAGAPVVESGVPSAGGASLVVDPLDPAAIGAGLLAASVDGARRDELVLAGRARTAELTWARAAAAHVELWAGLG
jgi:glycosyltransferase involved in cell wall biosynthesis